MDATPTTDARRTGRTSGARRDVLPLWVIHGGPQADPLRRILTARPDLGAMARETGEHYAELGVTLQSFMLAVLAGLVVTLMTRMQHSTESVGVRIVPAILFGALLVGAELFHCVLDAIFMIGAAVAGGDVSVGQWGVAVAWSALGNMVGGIGLVTFLRLLRTAPKVKQKRNGGS